MCEERKGAELVVLVREDKVKLFLLYSPRGYGLNNERGHFLNWTKWQSFPGGWGGVHFLF